MGLVIDPVLAICVHRVFEPLNLPKRMRIIPPWVQYVLRDLVFSTYPKSQQ